EGRPPMSECEDLQLSRQTWDAWSADDPDGSRAATGRMQRSGCPGAGREGRARMTIRRNRKSRLSPCVRRRWQMSATRLLSLVMAAILLGGSGLEAQVKGSGAQKLGTVHFAVSCTPPPHHHFELALTILPPFFLP